MTGCTYYISDRNFVFSIADTLSAVKEKVSFDENLTNLLMGTISLGLLLGQRNSKLVTC